MTEHIVEANTTHLEAILEMAATLWDDTPTPELSKTLQEILTSTKGKIYLFNHGNLPVGFIYMSIRTDYVEGSDHSPTGYVEGIFVKENYRRKGVSSRLLAAGEQWAKAKGCTQIGSDIFIDNQASYDFHTRVGFKEVSRLIAFIKDI